MRDFVRNIDITCISIHIDDGRPLLLIVRELLWLPTEKCNSSMARYTICRGNDNGTVHGNGFLACDIPINEIPGVGKIFTHKVGICAR